MPLFLLFLIVPLIEIALFIQVGGVIGLWWTLAIVILTAVAGTLMVRSQGLAVMARLRSSFEELNDPSEPLAHGAMILFSGALLLTPGFFTDAVGLLLLVPGIRNHIYRFFRKRFVVHEVTYGSVRPDPDIIEGDYEDLDAAQKARPSGWTRH